MQELMIKTEYIELKNVLKILGIVKSGGEVKLFLMENECLVNGELEQRRGRKLYDGDTVEVSGRTYTIRHEGSLS